MRILLTAGSQGVYSSEGNGRPKAAFLVLADVGVSGVLINPVKLRAYGNDILLNPI